MSMTKFESKQGKLNTSVDKVYNFLSNFNNFQHLIPADKAKNWESTEDTCSFSVSAMGQNMNISLEIVEKEPNKVIKFSNGPTTPFNFFFWMQLKEVAEDDSRIKLTLHAELNMMMKMMLKKKLEEGLNQIVDQLSAADLNRIPNF